MSFDQLNPNDPATIQHLLELRDELDAKIAQVRTESNQADESQEIDRLIRAGLIEASAKPTDPNDYAQFLSSEVDRIRNDAFDAAEVHPSMRERVSQQSQSVEEALEELGIDPLHPKSPLLERLHVKEKVQWARAHKTIAICSVVTTLAVLLIAAKFIGIIG